MQVEGEFEGQARMLGLHSRHALTLVQPLPKAGGGQSIFSRNVCPDAENSGLSMGCQELFAGS